MEGQAELYRENGHCFAGSCLGGVTDWCHRGNAAQGREKVVGPPIRVLNGSGPSPQPEVDKDKKTAREKEARVEVKAATQLVKTATGTREENLIVHIDFASPKKRALTALNETFTSFPTQTEKDKDILVHRMSRR